MRKYMLALTALLTSALLSVPAFAADFAGDREGSIGGGRDSVTDTKILISAIDDLVDVMKQVFNAMLSNPLLVVFLAAGLLTLGVRVYRKLKGAAKG